MDLNKFGRRAFKCALRRGKIHVKSFLHQETVDSLNEEMLEVTTASETELSEHLDSYSAVVEELADVAIVVFTELYRRNVDIEALLHAKMKFNENRP